MNDATIAGIYTVAGAIGLAVTNWVLNKGKSQIDLAAQLRDELRKDNIILREEMKQVQKELADCKNKCYALLESQGKLEVLNSDLKAEVIRLTQLLKDNNLKA